MERVWELDVGGVKRELEAREISTVGEPGKIRQRLACAYTVEDALSAQLEGLWCAQLGRQMLIACDGPARIISHC